MKTKNIYFYHIYYIQIEVNVQNIKLIFEFIMFMVQYTTVLHLFCLVIILLCLFIMFMYYIYYIYGSIY